MNTARQNPVRLPVRVRIGSALLGEFPTIDAGIDALYERAPRRPDETAMVMSMDRLVVYRARATTGESGAHVLDWFPE